MNLTTTKTNLYQPWFIQQQRNAINTTKKLQNSRKAVTIIIAFFLLAFLPLLSVAQTTTRYNDGYLTIYKVTNTAALPSTGTAIVTEEYAPAGGAPNFVLALPSSATTLSQMMLRFLQVQYHLHPML